MRAKQIIIAVLFTCACAPEEEHRAESHPSGADQAFRWAGAGSRDHGDMTEVALPFLKVNVADAIADANESTDSGSTQHQSRYHVDNCRLEESLATVRALHDQAVAAMDPSAPRTNDAIAAFGAITHVVQDFYAHSNWTESGQASILSKGDLDIAHARAGHLLGSMVVLPQTLPAGWSVTRPSGSRVPLVTLSNGATHPAWMSGTYTGNVDSSVCHSPVSIPHGDFLLTQNDPVDSYMAKDNPRTPYFEAARSLATAQTLEEFCRLDRRVTLRFGHQAHDLLMSSMIDDLSLFAARCGDNAATVAAIMMAAL